MIGKRHINQERRNRIMSAALLVLVIIQSVLLMLACHRYTLAAEASLKWQRLYIITTNENSHYNPPVRFAVPGSTDPAER